ncbi:HupE/UreJ family protein [Ideonella sp.]|uniref:HupE/UreJ family protein n=1 Tax=Ideonella sp. TaxID=1929293 RepID=UPI003BB4CC8B
MIKAARPVLSAALLGALPLLAQAHTGSDAGTHHGLLAGLTHPFTGLDHLAAMVAVGLWSASGASVKGHRAALLALPATFASLLLVGALMAATGLALPAIEPMIATSLLVLGLLLATRRGLPAPVAMALVGVFALFHGVAHGAELAGAAALAGMVAGTVLLHAGGLLASLALQRHQPGLIRWLGAGTALFGSALLLA